MNKRGFTIPELLISLGIMSVIVVALTQFFGNTLQTTSDFDRRNELQTEGQLAHQLISSRIQEAWYIYPNTTSITLAHTDAWRVTKPVNGGTDWTVGNSTNPFIAMILPPRNINANCDVATSATQGCYRFYAFYPLMRSTYTTQVTGTVANRLIADSGNPNAWVMMQYLGFFPSNTFPSGTVTDPDAAGFSATTFTTPVANLAGIRTDLLADYFRPTVVTESDYLPFSRVSANQVRVNLQLQRNARGKTFTVGGANSTLTATVFARNQGVVAPCPIINGCD